MCILVLLDAAQKPLWRAKKPPHRHQQRQQRRLAKIPSTAALLLGAIAAGAVLFVVGLQWHCPQEWLWSVACEQLKHGPVMNDHTQWWVTVTTTVPLLLPTPNATIPHADDTETSTSQDDDWFQTTIARGGLHFLTPVSGCALTAWVYESQAIPRKFRDCRRVLQTIPNTNSSDHVAHRRLRPHNVHHWAPRMQPHDTIYVTIKGLADFYREILPLLPVPVVLISGQWHKGINDTLEEPLVQGLLDHPLIAKWFCHNVDVYLPTSAIELSHQHLHLHAKLAPWPFGLQHAPYNPHDPTVHVDPLAAYRAAFVRHWHGNTRKTHTVFIGYTNPHTNPLRQHSVSHNRTVHWTPPPPPPPPRLNLTDYYDALARHRYVQSPNGDRPECYRHYEAIGLGTIPLTQLHPLYYAHLAPAPVVFNVTNYGHWNTPIATEALVRPHSFRHSIRHATHATNRRMVTEEYWIDYVERLVAMPVRWADDRAQHHQPRLQQGFNHYVPSVVE
jgi:hypothetical protein